MVHENQESFCRRLMNQDPISMPAIVVKNLSKIYEIYDTPFSRLLGSLNGKWGAKKKRPHKVFENLSFEVGKGEAFGIIGRNGSGKSTLLQIMCGTLAPTSGDVIIQGRVAALLELGAGFNPDFTGRENILISASLYGMTRVQVQERIDAILTFADIGDYIDQPVKSYSSGMFVRLAFAIIAHCDADILVIDEALAVGDVFFTQKCMRFIRRFVDGGGTLLFVSHDTSSVLSLCSRALMLFPNASHPPVVGDAESLCKDYLARIYEDRSRLEHVAAQRKEVLVESGNREEGILVYEGKKVASNTVAISGMNSRPESFGQGAARITDVAFFDDAGEPTRTIQGGDEVLLRVRAEILQAMAYPAFGFMFKDRHGQFVFTDGTDGRFRDDQLTFTGGDVAEVEFRFKFPYLLQGVYTLNVAIAEGLGDDHIQHHWIHDVLRMESVGGPIVHGMAGLHGMSCCIRVTGRKGA